MPAIPLLHGLFITSLLWKAADMWPQCGESSTHYTSIFIFRCSDGQAQATTSNNR